MKLGSKIGYHNMKKSKPGPKTDETKDCWIHIRFTRRELNKIKGIAKIQHNGNVSSLVRDRVLGGHKVGGHNG